MIAKVVVLFLVGMGVMAMFGKFTVPGSKRLSGKKRAKRCPKCGRLRVGRGSCPCEKG